MKRLPPLPTGIELGLFALVALATAGLATLVNAHDLAMAIFALPIFVFAAWMGMRRSGQWAAIARPAETSAVKVEEVEEEELAV
jgi:threonine/homoserine/homoserine lactone efflux protein